MFISVCVAVLLLASHPFWLTGPHCWSLFVPLLQSLSRFTAQDHKQRVLQNRTQLDPPVPFLTEFFKHYPEACTQLVTTEDWQHFMHLTRRKTQKPVPFILLFDDEFLMWFKKDTLWQSENVEMVPGQDADRVCILHGPVAAQHSTEINVPIKQLLDGIYEGQVQLILEKYYNGDSSSVPTVELLGGLPIHSKPSTLVGVTVVSDTPTEKVYQCAESGELPEVCLAAFSVARRVIQRHHRGLIGSLVFF